MSQRIRNLLLKLKEEELDGLIISSAANISYLSEYTCRDAYLLISSKGLFYFTDSRYTSEIQEALGKGFIIKETKPSFYRAIANACVKLKLNNVGFEGRYLPFAEYSKIKENFNKGMELTSTHSLVEELREIKEPVEVTRIKRASKIAAEALDFIKNRLSPGKTELQVAGEIEHFIRNKGARGSSFEIIVASGPNSRFAHHITSDRKIQKNDIILIDMGVDYLGYKSDLTRVFFLGKIKDLQRKVYQTVLDAQRLAIKEIKAGATALDIDNCARKHITKNGFGEFFSHNLGHGVGLEIHELPHLSPKSKEKLLRNMVTTVEPAIYLPGKFGIRLEDMILVKEKGCEIISGFSN